MTSLLTDYPKIEAVWNKGLIIPGYDANVWRHDRYGHVLNKHAYGQQTPHGWEIDHIWPTSLGGTDQLETLQPMHWKANRQKGNNFIG